MHAGSQRSASTSPDFHEVLFSACLCNATAKAYAADTNRDALRNRCDDLKRWRKGGKEEQSEEHGGSSKTAQHERIRPRFLSHHAFLHSEPGALSSQSRDATFIHR